MNWRQDSIKTGEIDAVHSPDHHGRSLADTRADLGVTRSKLRQLRNDTREQEKQKAVLVADLTAKQAELDALKASLLSTEGRVNVQAGTIATLRSCLDGVTLALVQVANNDLATAQQTLSGVQAPCRQAEALL